MHASCDIKKNIIYEGGQITYQMTDALAGFLLPHMRPILCILISARSFVFCACILHQCTMIPLLTRSCLKSNKLRPILNGQFCHAISKNIGLNLFGSKQPREILVFVILKL